MKLDDTILKCFEELINKADKVEKTIEISGYGSFLNVTLFFEWLTSVMSLFERIFDQNSSQINNFMKLYENVTHNNANAVSAFQRSKGILLSAYNDYKNGYLIKYKNLISAEVLDNVIEQAEELLKKEYKQAACIIAGVALETSLRKLCENEGIKTGKMDKMNADLAKTGKYNKSKQKQITFWAGLRNDAAHGDWQTENDNQIKPMIDGINAFIGDYL